MKNGFKDTLRSVPYLPESVQAVCRLFRQTPQQEYRQMYFPETTYPDDIFVDSYPKSGNTWVRLLLTEVLVDTDGERSGWEHHRVVPDLYRNRAWADEAERPRYMKTHEAWFDRYPRCLYVVRDGRDVMVSYYHYLEDFHEEINDFSTFLRVHATWPTRWHTHVKRALHAAQSRPDDFLIVRFEDLKNDDVRELRRMVDFCDIDASPDDIKRAVQACRFSALKEKEQEHGHPDEVDEAEAFFRSGTMDQWEDVFSDEDLRWFMERSHDVMEQLNYV